MKIPVFMLIAVLLPAIAFAQAITTFPGATSAEVANNLSDLSSFPASLANIAGGMAANLNLTGTDTISLSGGNQKLTLTANETLTIQKGSLPITASATQLYFTQFEICQNGTGNFTLAFATGTGVTNLYWSGGSQPGYTLTALNGDWYACDFDNTSLRCKETISNVPC